MIAIATVTLEEVMAQWGASHRPIVKPEIARTRLKAGHTKWKMQLVEIWPDEARFGASDLDKIVYWTESILKNWSTAKRSSWDIWIFDTKRDAEKFITLYNLTWA